MAAEAEDFPFLQMTVRQLHFETRHCNSGGLDVSKGSVLLIQSA
jgi:hypothetical protein